MNALKMSHDHNAKPIKRISGYNSRGLLPRGLQKYCLFVKFDRVHVKIFQK